MTAGYMATVNDGAPTDLQMDGFKLSLVFGWHPGRGYEAAWQQLVSQATPDHSANTGGRRADQGRAFSN